MGFYATIGFQPILLVQDFFHRTAQVGSIVTVGALSLIDAFSFGPRILGGFLGQLLCLAAILGFRWGSKGLGRLGNGTE